MEALHEIWPQAPIYTAWVDWSWLKKEKPEWRKWKIIPSWFDKIPFKKQLCSPLRFLTPWIWRSFYHQLQKYDVVISSSAWYMSKGVSLLKLKAKSLKLKTKFFCYCHTPPRYLYGYPTASNFNKYWWGRLYANIINPFMRYYDFKSSQTVDYFICNSKEVQQRIKKFYRREAQVIYPPISFKSQITNHKSQKIKDENYFLMVNRLVRPKNIDLAIRACKKLKINLKIIGSGPDEKRLRKIANSSSYIKFLGFVDDQQLTNLYSDCQAVLYLAEEEDFGITPVEAMSFGKPVIALKSGGVKESVIEGKTGLFIKKPEVEELVRRLQNYKITRLQARDCIKQAEKFSKERFKNKIKTFVEEKLRK